MLQTADNDRITPHEHAAKHMRSHMKHKSIGKPHTNQNFKTSTHFSNAAAKRNDNAVDDGPVQ